MAEAVSLKFSPAPLGRGAIVPILQERKLNLISTWYCQAYMAGKGWQVHLVPKFLLSWLTHMLSPKMGEVSPVPDSLHDATRERI